MSDATRYFVLFEKERLPLDSSENVQSESLVENIKAIVNDLQKLAFAKYGRAKRLQNDLFVNKNLMPYLESSVLFQKSSDNSCYGKIADMNIHYDHVLHEDRIRIVSEFDVEEDPPKMYHGTVMIIKE
jgi:hypothetical protein